MGQVRESSDEDIRNAMRPRMAYSRKGENGIVLVVGGSWLYHGAPALAAMAAFRCGIDLAYIAVPEKIATAIRALSPNFIVLPLPDLKLTKGSARRLEKVLPEVDAAVVGPGLVPKDAEALTFLLKELLDKDIALVLDAAALIPDVLDVVKEKKVVLTPHAGEFKRLFGIELPRGAEERTIHVKKKALEYSLTILLKGPVDVISDGKEVVLNRTGTPAMTVGGTGDVLAGLVAGFISKGAKPVEAAVAAARVNGLAGERATARLGYHIVASDLLDEIPQVLKAYDATSED
ncbi:MAG: NAD(P)H-hydrate dehydratase [Nitrososphaerota archaeon]